MGQDSRVRFEQYSFPVLPGLVYEKDGNERIGELLFIDDSRNRFQIYFESGMSCLDLRIWERDPGRVIRQKHSFGDLTLYLSCPVRDCGGHPCVNYFHVELIDADGMVHILPGQISLEHPARQLDSLCCITALCELLDGLRVEACAAEEAAGA